MLWMICRIVLWAVAAAWWWKCITVWRGMNTVPDLHAPAYDGDGPMPSLAVVVPACNEADTIREALRSLLLQQYPRLQIIAINDRSTDGTGTVLAELAEAYPGRLTLCEVTELPRGWLGKTHAMVVGASASDAEYLLFTDADVHFRADTLSRAMQCVKQERADHFVVLPTTQIHQPGEAAVLGFFQLLGTWAVRLWRVSDPHAPDAIGVGAFNLVRREAYEAIGGFAALRMEIVEDLALARRLKAAGFRSRVATGRDLVSLHWASGVGGIVRVMTKNLFSAFRFHLSLALIACAWLLLFGVAPFLALLHAGSALPGIATVAALLALHWRLGRYSGLATWNALLTPFAALTFCYALVRSVAVTLYQGGVRWRGTFYRLDELKRQSPALPTVSRRMRP